MKNLGIQILISLLFIPAVSAQIDRSKAPEPGPAPEIKIGEYNSFQLKNGLQVFVVENHKIPRVAYSLVLDIDPFTEGENIGYTSLAGDLLGTATTTRTKDQIDEEVDFIGATLTTSSGSLYGMALKKHNLKLLELMSDVLLNPVFSQEELDKKKKQAKSAIAFDKTDPSAIADVVSDVLRFGKDHPYGEVLTEESVESVTLEMCENYYKTYFRPNIAYMAIVGDINLKEAKKLIRKYFGNWEPAEVPDHRYPRPVAPEKTQVSIVDRPHAVQSVIRVTYPVKYTVGMDDYVAARVMNLILGGTFARLDQNLREDHAYTYGVHSILDQDKWVGSFTVSTDVRNEVTDSSVYQILREMERLRTEKAPPEEVEKIKNYMSGNFALALEQPGTVARFALNIARYKLPSDYYTNYLKYISEVGPDDIQAVAQKYLEPDHSHILIVGKAEEIVDKLKGFSPSQTIHYFNVEGNPVDPASLAGTLPQGLTAEAVIENYLSAIGGREALERIKDMTIRMAMESQGMQFESEMIRKAPDKFSMSIHMGENLLSKTICDGQSAKISGLSGEQVLEGDELEKMKLQAMFMPELDYAGKGFSLELMAVENVDGKKAYKIGVTDPAGHSSLVWYDCQNGFRLREESTEETPQGPITQTTGFGDYREVDGVSFPYTMHILAGPQSITMTVTGIQLNTGIEDAVFK